MKKQTKQNKTKKQTRQGEKKGEKIGSQKVIEERKIKTKAQEYFGSVISSIRKYAMLSGSGHKYTPYRMSKIS